MEVDSQTSVGCCRMAGLDMIRAERLEWLEEMLDELLPLVGIINPTSDDP